MECRFTALEPDTVTHEYQTQITVQLLEMSDACKEVNFHPYSHLRGECQSTQFNPEGEDLQKPTAIQCSNLFSTLSSIDPPQ